MSISVGNTMLQEATKVLLMHWNRAKSEWSDEKARQFEQDYLDMLRPRLRSALAAMDRAAEIVSQARSECE
ncbi:MAG: hypothetical protein AB7G11_16385 [Phycisphaerales bacterium]